MQAPSGSTSPRRTARGRALTLAVATIVVSLVVGACDAGTPAGTPPITPGTSAAPREVNIVARDYTYVPSVIDLAPGETVTLHVLNGGLEQHEAIIGTLGDQLAWEAGEEAVLGAPPGPTPNVPSPAGFEGVRVVVGSGQRVDVTWTVPPDAASAPGGWFVGCHIPGHWQKGMVVPVRLVGPDGHPEGTVPPLPSVGPAGG
ncbi:MAG TPA: hypothetical protein VGM28_09650 [Candidatus Limnocylindrales bacterium]|jgi:uncharacterized cupredoxin-like copper-binding protein